MVAAFEIAERVSGGNSLVFEEEVGNRIGHEEGPGRRHSEMVVDKSKGDGREVGMRAEG